MEEDQPDMSLSAPNNHAFNVYMTPYTPQNFGRPSSPLNPHAGSSSPITSPTPQHLPHPHSGFTLQHHMYPAPSAIAGPSRPPRPPIRGRNSLPSPVSSSSTRYARRPTAPAQARTSLPSASGLGLGGPLDLFTEGTSPVQGQLWRDRLGRRMEERERRKRSREDDMGRRRGMSGEEGEDQEAADKRAQEDDEEIFRRLMVLQRRKAEHAALVSHEQETGGSDPLEPEFWEEELSQYERYERSLQNFSRMVGADDPQTTPRQNRYTPFASSSSLIVTPQHRIIQPRRERGGGDVEMGSYREQAEAEEDWAEEAAAAEEAEREAEELAMLERVEREYVQAHGGGQVLGDDGGMEVEWDELEQMDME